MSGARGWAAAMLAGLLAAVLLTSPAEAAAIPKSLKATGWTATTLTLDWQSVTSAPQYRVQYSTSPNMTSPVSIRFTKSEGTLKDLKPDTAYWFRVRVISKSGTKNLSAYTKAPYPTARTLAMAVPNDFHITSRVSNALGVAWTPSEGAVKYELQHSKSEDMSSATTISTTLNDLTVKSLDAETDYWFRVRAVSSSGVTTAYTSAVKGATTPTGQSDPSVTDADLRVASFNIFGINADSTATGNRKVWSVRKPEVARDIVDNMPDVVGLQEANQSTVYYAANSGMTQYFDLLKAVNDRGATYALANDKNYNCVRYVSLTDCVYKYQGASRGVRILYNTATLAMQEQGSLKYKAQTGSVDRYLAWATFRIKANGRTFLFVTTHLQPHGKTVQIETRKAQWRELSAWAKDKGRSLGVPVVIGGDFNTSRNTDYAAQMLPMMEADGFGDVLGQKYRENPIRSPRAEKSELGWINTHNGWSKDLRKALDGGRWTFYEDRNMPQAEQRTGSNIDWIFASNGLRVKEWGVVVRYDASTLKVTRTVPSDHNMIRSTLVVPPPT